MVIIDTAVFMVRIVLAIVVWKICFTISILPIALLGLIHPGIGLFFGGTMTFWIVDNYYYICEDMVKTVGPKEC